MLRKDYFLKKDAHALDLGRACLNLFDTDFLEWEPKSVYQSLKEQGFGDLPESNAVKINAFRVCFNTIMPWTDWEVFEKVGHGLLGTTPNFDLREPLTVAECMNTVNVLNQIRVVDYAYDIRAYIASCAKSEEIEYLPGSLEFCMPLLCEPMYTCLDCGNRDTDDLVDGRCDVCVGRYEDGIPNGKPSEGLHHLGKNIHRSLAYSYSDIADAYRKVSVLDTNVLDLGEGYLAIQLAKLIAVRDFCKQQNDTLGLAHV